MAAHVGFMTNPIISGSVLYLTSFNISIIILILLYITPCSRFTGVATASILPAHAHEFSDIQEQTVTSISLIVAFIVPIIYIILIFWHITIIKFSKNYSLVKKYFLESFPRRIMCLLSRINFSRINFSNENYIIVHK
jgi:hypothetical protein